MGVAGTRDYDVGTLPINQQIARTKHIPERLGMLHCSPVHTPGYRPEL